MKVLKIASLLLFICFVSFGQTSVPNTDTFSLQDVYNVVHGHASGTQTNLQSCFDNSVDSYFDTNYKGSKNSLYNFRNYTVSGCVAPTVTTDNISSIRSTYATGGGNITSDGGCTVTARGVCWNTGGSPTVSDSHTTDGSGTGTFSSSITGLTCGNRYYVRAYATNSQGTSYGNEVSFISGHDDATTTITLWYAMLSSNCTNGNFTSSFNSACQARADYNNGSCLNKQLFGEFLRVYSYAVGQQVYYPPSLNKCEFTSTGYFWDRNSDKIVHVISGVIQSIASCP